MKDGQEATIRTYAYDEYGDVSEIKDYRALSENGEVVNNPVYTLCAYTYDEYRRSVSMTYAAVTGGVKGWISGKFSVLSDGIDGTISSKFVEYLGDGFAGSFGTGADAIWEFNQKY